MANIGEQATELQIAAKELKNQIGKVIIAFDKATSNVTPYHDSLIGGNGMAVWDTADKRVLIDMERKAKQIMIVIKDFDTATLSINELSIKANEIISKFTDSN